LSLAFRGHEIEAALLERVRELGVVRCHESLGRVELIAEPRRHAAGNALVAHAPDVNHLSRGHGEHDCLRAFAGDQQAREQCVLAVDHDIGDRHSLTRARSGDDEAVFGFAGERRRQKGVLTEDAIGYPPPGLIDGTRLIVRSTATPSDPLEQGALTF
jgi:hypothetical protein